MCRVAFVTRLAARRRNCLVDSSEACWPYAVCVIHGVPNTLPLTTQGGTSGCLVTNSLKNILSECQIPKCRGRSVMGRRAGPSHPRVQGASRSISVRSVLTLPQAKIHERINADLPLFEQQLASSEAVQERFAALTANVDELNDAVSHSEVVNAPFSPYCDV